MARRSRTTVLRSGSGALFAAAVLIAGCSPPVSSEHATRSAGLSVTADDDAVYCDDTLRPAATITGAGPGETIEFTSPMPIDIGQVAADESGAHQLMWRCNEAESGLSWQITATGGESGRSVSFTVSGSDRDPLLDQVLVYEPLIEVVVCDDTTRTVGRLSNAEPNEFIDYTSPDSFTISPATAGADGGAEVLWTCSVDDDGRDWHVTATGASSGRTVDFAITGQAPRPDAAGGIVVEVVEDPFVCDRGRRPVARLSNLTPVAVVEFDVSPPVESLTAGVAGGDGSMTVFWQCNRRDDGTTWEMTVTESTPTARSTSFTFGSTTLESPVTIEIIDEQIVCDGASHQFAVLRNFVPSEAIDFESPQTNAIRQGRAGSDGSLPLRWFCDTGQIGTTWEVTASGVTSGASLTFAITGVAP